MGRPKAEIDFKKVDDYLKAQCSGAAIAGILGIHPDTLYKAIEDKYKLVFSAYSALKKAEGKEILRKSLWDSAIKGNVPISIWLSKQYLGMSESLEKLSEEAIELVITKLKEKYETRK
ncbi:MAG TPA: hypothetical protein VIK14_16355 [Ignavibacteria bacterium]